MRCMTWRAMFAWPYVKGTGASTANSAYKLASLAKLTEIKPDPKSSSSSSSKSGGATLLHYLAKTVEAWGLVRTSSRRR